MNCGTASRLPLGIPSPQLLVSDIRRLLGDTTSQVTGGLVAMVGDASLQRLEWVMRTPLRRVVLDAIFWQMPRFIDPERAARVNGTVRWYIVDESGTSGEIYDLVVANGSCRAIRGGNGGSPRLTITIDGTELLRLIGGNSDLIRAYFAHRLALSGDIIFAAKLVSLFHIPKPPASERRSAPRQRG